MDHNDNDNNNNYDDNDYDKDNNDSYGDQANDKVDINNDDVSNTIEKKFLKGVLWIGGVGSFIGRQDNLPRWVGYWRILEKLLN